MTQLRGKEPTHPLIYLLPSLPARMCTEFTRFEHQSQPRNDYEGRKGIRGRWVYDYNTRSSLVEFVENLQDPTMARPEGKSRDIWRARPDPVLPLKRIIQAPLLKTSILFDYAQKSPKVYRWRSKGVRGLHREALRFDSSIPSSRRAGAPSEIWQTSFTPLTCQRYSLVDPYLRMFSPSSFQKLGQATV